MNDALLMRGFQRLGNLTRDRQNLVHWDWPAGNAIRERLTVHEFHDERLDAIRFLQTINRRDLGMVQCREHFGFALKRANRSASAANDSGRIFSATSRFRRVSRARYTSPIPPTPSNSRTS